MQYQHPTVECPIPSANRNHLVPATLATCLLLLLPLLLTLMLLHLIAADKANFTACREPAKKKSDSCFGRYRFYCLYPQVYISSQERLYFVCNHSNCMVYVTNHVFLLIQQQHHIEKSYLHLLIIVTNQSVWKLYDANVIIFSA